MNTSSDQQNQQKTSDRPTVTDWQEIHSATRPGDRYIRINRLKPEPANLATPQTINWDKEPHPTLWRRTKHFLLGKPIATARAGEERMSKFQALAVLSSDALSSVAYATEAALFVLVTGFSQDHPNGWIIPISLLICLLTAIVAGSYRQTIFAYPGGGGSYLVAKDNFGVTVGLFAAAALMIDYVLNVAVSIASGTANFVSAFPDLYPYRIPLMLGMIVLLIIGNLRGIRESGAIFALPVYFFIGSFLVLITTGLYQVVFTQHATIIQTALNTSVVEYNTQAVGLILILQAFASGCTAMTGVEAISNGVPAFRKPESKNAAITLVWMAALLIVFFMGISFLADQFQARPTKDDVDTIISQLSRTIFGNNTIMYFVVQAATTLILIMSANTSFADFPRMSSILSHDKFLPHIFQHRGDRLAFSTGIIALGGLAALLLLIFNGSVEALIPLFAVGVFLAFTLSQAGMVLHWRKEKRKGVTGTLPKQFINGLGAICTGVALIVIAAGKFMAGAWVVILLIPVLFIIFKSIHHHYAVVAAQIEADSVAQGQDYPDNLNLQPDQPYQIIVPIAALNRISRSTLNFARSLSDKVTAIYVSDDPAAIHQLKQNWAVTNPHIPLVVLETPYRSVVQPLLAYLDEIHERHSSEVVMVMLPEFVVRHWWEQILHNQTALRLKAALLRRSGVVVTDVPYHLH